MFDDDRFITTNRLISGYQLAKFHTFEAAARYCSFIRAAEELCITPSAVSHQINKLEEELNFKLFNRFHRRIELTPDGENLFNILKKSLSILNKEIFEIKSQELIGQLTIYSRPSFAQGWLVPRISEFNKKHPYIILNILTGNEIINFDRHRIDLAIYFDDLEYNDLDVYHLMNETIVPVCSPQYAEYHQLTENIENLKNCLIIHDNQAWGYDTNFDEWQSWVKHFNLDLDFEDLPTMLFDRSDLAILAAINHSGIAMGRKHIINKYFESKELVTPFPNMTLTCKQRYYVVSASKGRNPKVKAFVRWLKENLAEQLVENVI